MRRFNEGKDRRVGFRADGVEVDWTTGRLERFGIGPGQIRADCLPCVPLVGALQHPVAADVERVWIVRRDDDWIGPGESLFVLAGAKTARRVGPARDQPDLIGGSVVSLERISPSGGGANRADIDDVGIVRTNRDIATLAGTGDEAILPEDAGVVGAAGNRDAGVILLRAVHVVRIPAVGSEVIELGGRLVVNGAETVSAVERDVRSTVVALNHPLVVLRVDPEVVVVTVGSGNFGECLAAVGALPKFEVVDVDG